MSSESILIAQEDINPHIEKSRTKARGRVSDIEAGRKEITYSEESWNGKDTLFLKSDSGDAYVMMDERSYNKIVKLLRSHQDEMLRLRLEKEILQNMPIDFDDVWIVAMNEIRKSVQVGQSKHIDTRNVVRSIKKTHPNLFFDMESLISGGNQENLF